ncbi:MAG: type 2 isopentenyl-diphosphate Delta-isomerase [Acidaminococcaceae bacterium]
MTRETRKLEHINYTLKLADGPQTTGFEDIRFLHNCLPEANTSLLTVATKLATLSLKEPLIINAITGGTNQVTTVNKMLAEVAQATGCAMAVGSQAGAVRQKQIQESYQIVRKTNPQGVVFANVSAQMSVAEAQFAVEMLEAQALQIHLNAAQELVMTEGDKDFTGYLKNIEQICSHLTVPVIVKETGCGIASEQATQLISCGVQILDVGGAGGTNFPAIEAARKPIPTSELLVGWGIPTALTIIEAKTVAPATVGIIATGGIRTAVDIVKALALGADAVGMSGNILRNILQLGVDGTITEIKQLQTEIKTLMLLLGVKEIKNLQKVPLLFEQVLFEQLYCRGYNLPQLSKSR